MSLILLTDKKILVSEGYAYDHSLKFKFLFNKAYGKNFCKLCSIEKLHSKKINKGDFILLTFFPELKKLKEIKKLIEEKNSFLGIYFGDTQQYLDSVFSYYSNFLDFCFTGEVAEAYLFEAFCGLAAFHHPINAIRNLDYYNNPKHVSKNKNRLYDFVHIGRFDNERLARMDLKKNLLQTKSKYLLLGPSKGCQLVRLSELHNKISNCNFGFVSCEAPTSTPLSKIKITNQYQFKGKIWEYILAGCIPVLDYAPNTYRFGLKEGIHYIRLESFSKSNIEKLLLLDQKVIIKMRKSLFKLAEQECSIKSLKEAFNEFKSSSMLFAPKKVETRISNELMVNACFDYSLKRKKFSASIIFSGFYFFKIFNKIREFLIFKKI